jgi:hypothetical protein
MTPMLCIRATIASSAMMVLTGCGVVSFGPPSRPTQLTPAVTAQLVKTYYDDCGDHIDVGQCTGVLSAVDGRPSLGFSQWIRFRQHADTVLTFAGAAHCRSGFPGEQQMRYSAGQYAVNCLWLYAPVLSVHVEKVVQHNDLAAVVASATFAPDSAIESWMRNSGDDLDTAQMLERAQGSPRTLHLTFENGTWIVGDAHPTAHFMIFLFVAIGLLLVAGWMGRERNGQDAGFGAGALLSAASLIPGPNIGDARQTEAMRVLGEPAPDLGSAPPFELRNPYGEVVGVANQHPFTTPDPYVHVEVPVSESLDGPTTGLDVASDKASDLNVGVGD